MAGDCQWTVDVAAAAAPQRRPRLCCPHLPSFAPRPRAELTLVAFFAAYSPQQQLLFYLFYLTFLLCECATVCVCVQVCVSAGDHCAAVAAVAVAVAGENPKVPRDSAKC